MAKKQSKKEPKRFKKLWIIFLSFWGTVFVFFTLLSFGLLGFMPSFEELENPKSNLASEVYSYDGVLLGYIGIENRSNVHYDELSPNLTNALIATEDARFWNHSGVDLRSLMRVFGKTVLGGNRGSGGGSTITQQLAKNLFPREQKSKLGVIFAKLKEWVVAAKLEHNYSKEEIIAMYFNTVDFGSNAFGIKSASQTFFKKRPSELSVGESAVLVGLLKAPSAYSPVAHPEKSQLRRNVVLKQMVKYEYLEENEYETLSKKSIDMKNYQPQTHNDGLATYFREYLRSYLKEWCSQHKKPNGEPYDIHRDGLKIYTTIDSRMQKYAEEAVKEHIGGYLQPEFFKHWKNVKNAPFTGIPEKRINEYYEQAMKISPRYQSMKTNGASKAEIEKAFHTKVKMRIFTWKGERDTMMSPWDSIKYYKFFLHAGLMSVEPQTGYVKAYVGGINNKYFQFDNVTQGRRQVGSTFKPFVYTIAMQDGNFAPCSVVPNTEVCFERPFQEDWCPKNSSHEKEGEMVTLRWALANSVNYISAYLMKQHSPESVINLVRRMGIKSPIDAVPAICLGTPDLSVKEMAGAMAVYANKGEYIEPMFIVRIQDNKGIVLQSFVPEQNEAMSASTAFTMIDLMRGVVESGTGGRIRYRYGLNYPIAGKTGTTDNNSDGWFIGITPKLATAVWVGGELRSIHFRSTSMGQGASMALPIWALYMKRVYNDPKISFYKGEFERPSGYDAPNCSNYTDESENERMIHDF